MNSRTFNSYLNDLKRDWEIGPEKYIVALKAPYTDKISVCLEKKY